MKPPRDPYRPFRPTRGPIVALAVGFACLIGFIALLVTVGSSPNWLLIDKLLSGAFLTVGLFLLWRQASVRAQPDDEGLTVRNFIRTTRLSWAQIISVRFGQGRPWAVLDLANGTELAVMAIQRADGDAAMSEARRLATLIEEHEVTGSD
ncbi:PH domain-containing protein [Bowdeniella massiliensis]|uniref:PH domain-containing protein n=1 Tax=Bowdeniella massiliensis TaxID=2932264 RepID=UPI002028AA87